MKTAWLYFLFLSWVTYLFVCGILLFTKGFLLSRRTLPHKSSCVENLDCGDLKKLAENEPSSINNQLYLDCLDRDQLKLRKNTDRTLVCSKNERKVVLVVIDALKYDFAFYNSSLDSTNLLPHQNKLPIFNELLSTVPNNSRLFKFIANPPTTTMQRLKGLTTGSLPTFIDVGSNFATPEIEEDNILDQLLSVNKQVVFMGDDTWLNLYPKRFLRQYPFPSFNVWDLDTVDSGIMKHLMPEIHKKDWSLLITHFLGVDHCGHRYGPFHPEMSRKLSQMNNVIRDIVDTIDDNTILFVIGDHGMTSSGDHGGESEDEVTSAMFVYSPVPLLSFEKDAPGRAVYQVDLVPTLASLLGFPIPFSNLGKVVLEALPATIHKNVDDTEWLFALDTLLINIEQIMLYINTYSRHTNVFSKDRITTLLQKFHDLKTNVDHVNSLKNFQTFKHNSMEFLNFVRVVCEEVWVQFDSFSMSRGLVLTFLLLTFCFFIVEGIPGDQFIKMLENGFLWIAYGIVIMSAVISFFLEYQKLIDDSLLLNYVLTLTMSIFIMAILVVQNWQEITTVWYMSLRFQEPSDILARLVHACCIFAVFSNSFVVEEGTVLLYFLNSLTWVIALNTRTAFKSESRLKTMEKWSWYEKLWHHTKCKTVLLAFLISILLRISRDFWRCREEQHWCVVAAGAHAKVARGNMDYVLPLVILALFVSVCRMWLRSCGNLVGFSPNVTLARYAPSVIAVCTGGFWVLQGLPKETRSRLFVPWQLQILPWVVFILCCAVFICIVFRPLCVYVLEKRADILSVYGHDNIIPQLFHQVKEVMKKESNNGPSIRNNPVVYGLATSFSSVFIIKVQFVSLLVILLIGETLSTSVIILFLVIVLLLVLFSYVRIDNTIVAAQLFSVPWTVILCWGLLSSYFFYGTGHQPTFPGIHWYSAFVGTGGEFPSYIIPAILVGLNTFCSQIITGLSLPLLIIAPFTLYVMLPKWLHYKEDNSAREFSAEELKQGELYLYEKEGLMNYSCFKLASKYIFLHGTRVFACMLAAAIHCRHLMVWMIFAPKLIFEGVGFFVTLGSVLLSFIIMIQISSSIEQLMHKLLNSHR